MANKLTRTEKAARLDAFLSNDDNFEAVAYNDPRAIALRNKAAARNAKRENIRAARDVEILAQASTFSAGQIVKTPNRISGARGYYTGPVLAVEGKFVTIESARGAVTLLASALVAA